MHSNTGNYCVNELQVLQLEGRWLDNLILLHFSKLAIFTLWEYNEPNLLKTDYYVTNYGIREDVREDRDCKERGRYQQILDNEEALNQ